MVKDTIKQKNKKTIKIKEKRPKGSLKKSTEPTKGSIKRAERKTKQILLSYIRNSELDSWEKFDVLDASVQFKILTGFHPNVRVILDNGKVIDYNTAREWFERASIQTQCDNVIGQFKKGTICYMCGLPIYGPAECEHVLAVFKAAMYLHLYRTDFKPILLKPSDELTPQEKRIIHELKMEYRWAHRCCNQVKSDHDFVKFDGRKFAFDKIVGRRILKEILKKTISGETICNDPLFKREIDNLRLKNGEDIERWIDQRINILMGTDVKKGTPTPDYALGAVGDIIDYLNGGHRSRGFGNITADNNKGGFYLCSLSTALAAMDTSHYLDVLRHQRGLPPIEPVIIRHEVTKPEVIINTISELTRFLSFNWGRQLDIEKIRSLYTELLETEIPAQRDMSKPQISSILAEGLIKLINQNETVETFDNDFFQNMKVLLHMPPTAESNRLIDSKLDASEIAGVSYSMFIILHFILKLTELTVYKQYNQDAIMLQFVDQFKISLKINFSQIIRFLPDANKQLLYLNIFQFLLGLVHPDQVNKMMQILIESLNITDYTYTGNQWTTVENLKSSVVHFMWLYPEDESRREYPTEYREVLAEATLLFGIKEDKRKNIERRSDKFRSRSRSRSRSRDRDRDRDRSRSRDRE